MKKIVIVMLVIVGVFLVSSCTILALVDMDEVNTQFEYAYFEGQRDALDGDIRIKLNQDSCYIWCKSPWDSGKQPTYDPSFNCKQK